MIVRILSQGSSFKGLGTYLTHDPKAQTTERVAWTHTLNLAHDDVPSAIDEMLWTARQAELLKQEAGIRAGGRATEDAVKHVSLNWSPDQKPSQEHMVETSEAFLRHMGWNDHQALLVSHNDRPHAHVHLMVNVIHPENGLRLDDDFERRRAQAWALAYERENGRIYCEQRLQDIGAREDGPTRPAWMAFQEKQKEFEREEKNLGIQEPILIRDREMPENTPDAEWKILKAFQRQQREAFFAEGKLAFSELRTSVYREVREEFRDRWGDFYAAQKEGGDPAALAEIKAKLVADQKEMLESRRDLACSELRENRNDQYRELLDDQRDLRLGLRWRQEAGLDNTLFLEAAERRNTGREATDAFREAAAQTMQHQSSHSGETSGSAFAGHPKKENSGMRSGSDIGVNIGSGLGFGLLSFFGSLGDGLVASKPDPMERQPEQATVDPEPFEAVIVDAHSQQQREQAEEDERQRRQRSLYGE